MGDKTKPLQQRVNFIRTERREPNRQAFRYMDIGIVLSLVGIVASGSWYASAIYYKTDTNTRDISNMRELVEQIPSVVATVAVLQANVYEMQKREDKTGFNYLPGFHPEEASTPIYKSPLPFTPPPGSTFSLTEYIPGNGS